MATEITGRQFNPNYIRRYVTRQFEKEGLEFSEKGPEIGRRLVREGGRSLAHVTFYLKSGLKLKLGVKFNVEEGKILPKSKGLVYSAKLGTTMIPLAKPKGQDYDWTSWIKKISEFVKNKEKTLKPKAPTISKAKATDNKIPNTFAGKVEAKRTALAGKKEELASQTKLVDDQTKENERLESEIEGFKKGTAVESGEKPSGKGIPARSKFTLTENEYKELQKNTTDKTILNAVDNHITNDKLNVDGIENKYKLPKITGGTEKQIKYARDIRRTWIISSASDIALALSDFPEDLKGDISEMKKIINMTNAKDIISS